MALSILLCLAACGGRSVSYAEESGAGPSREPPSVSAPDGCVSLCESCGMDADVGAASCDAFCARVKGQAATAECSPLFDAFVDCRRKSTAACSYQTCPNQTNNLTVCVLGYCDEHSVSAPELCSTW